VLRVVLDTNVFVSGLLNKTGLPASILDAWRAGRYLLCTSPAIISEISAVLDSLWRGRKYHLTREDVTELTRLLEQDALVVPAQVNVRGAIPDDPSDEMFLACAVDAAANFIVTGDKHLLDLKTCRGIPIVTVQQFAEHLKSLTTL
jgi:hypothetical protein